MKKQGYNPYLPSWEYVPDGEAHVFGDRVYLYGSHDRFNGYAFCLNDYVCYSAPVTDLSDWKFEGVIYGRTDDPENQGGEMCLYAPDVARGADGRYYLYYVLDQCRTVSVAVCDTPAGRYRFYGKVHYEDGTMLGEREGDMAQFDPGVLFENGKLYLYTGSCPRNRWEKAGPTVTVLREDMLTVAESPRTVVPSRPHSQGSGFEGHEFFEASSIRKAGERYYFVYSSVEYHELCYAVSDSPTEGFRYGGVIVSNNDIGIDTDKPWDLPTAYGGNNHGGIENINGQWYVFYHRHTNGTAYSRQGCAEPVTIREDGSISQVEMTSCGPNGGPLSGRGYYPAYIACNLFTSTPRAWSGGMGQWIPPEFPRITQEGRDGDENEGYVDNLTDGATVGYKYFRCEGISEISVRTRGRSRGGKLVIMTERDGEALGEIPVYRSNEWKTWSAKIRIPDGVHALYFRFCGGGVISLAGFTLG